MALPKGGLVARDAAHAVEEYIRYKKTGEEIKNSLATRIYQLKVSIEDSKAEVSRICKLREIDAKEVFAAGINEDAVETYSTRATSHIVARGALEELQRDLSAIRTRMFGIHTAQESIEYFERIIRNIEPERSFDLPYSRLVEFGF